ncbi:MAG: hypothetical protein ABUK13_03470 [Gammaproteobacteria bacterium]
MNINTPHLILGLMLAMTSITSWADTPNKADFAISGTQSIQGKPTLAYDPGHDTYLVTWSDHRDRLRDVDIYGRLLNGQGKPIGEEFPISIHKGGQGMSAVSFDEINNRFLVVWVDWRNANDVDSDIYGQLVNADGSLYGNNFIIAERRTSQKQPTVAFDPTRQRFLVVWKDFRDGKIEKIYGRYLNSKGKIIGDEFRIAKGEGKQDRPSLFYDPKRKRFLAVWRDIVDENQYLSSMIAGSSIFAAFIDPEHPLKQGDQLQDALLIAAVEDACLPPSLYSTAYSPEKDLFMIVWTSGRDYQKLGLDVYGALIRGSDGKRISEELPIATQYRYQEFPAVVYDAKRQRFLVAWYDLRRGDASLDMDIFGRYVTTDGEMTNEFLISDSDARNNRRFPAMAVSPKHDKALVIWEDRREKTPQAHRSRIFGRVQTLGDVTRTISN